MRALPTNSNYILLPVVHGDDFNQPLIRPLVYKHIQSAHERNFKEQKVPKTRNQFTYMGIAIPFMPCMWDDKTIAANWNKTKKMVQEKMNEKFNEVCITQILARLEKLFLGINLNTNRKSLAITLTPNEENIIYLSFSVRPTVLFSDSVPWLDLAANIQREPDFYYLVLNKEDSSLYDYNNKQLRRVHEQKNEPCPTKLFNNVEVVIELLSGKNEKPVFVTGSPNLVEQFCNSKYFAEIYFPLLYHKAPFNSEIIQSIVKEITGHWRYWHSNFIAGSILLAQKTNGLISQTESVLQALRRGADGLLLIDKRLKHTLQKPSSEKVTITLADDLTCQIEKFLSRGNRFEITETGFLNNFGGIVLLKSNRPASAAFKLYGSNKSAGGSFY